MTATYVLMLKEYEDDNKVIFKFGPNENKMGRIEINKVTREYVEIEAIPDTDTTFYYNCTVSKLLRSLKENPNQEFPQKMFYAS